ncbi:MAG: PilZ domain-containing protein [Deltaproteobacteria bacterium]|nr:PilZ domain-containing protein [Deltaproteobacteria bacterium]
MDFFYVPLTVDDPQTDEASILDVLTDMWRKELSSDLMLLNYYEMLPISYSSTILNVHQGQVELAVHRNQAVVMLAQKLTFLKSSHFPHHVLAVVQGAQIERQLALLSRYSYVTLPAERRKNLRVNMEGRFEAVIQFGSIKITGTVHDLSIAGIAVNSGQLCLVEEGTPGKITFTYNGKTTSAKVKLMRFSDDAGMRKYIVSLELDAINERNVYQIIMLREHEIIQKLRDQVERQLL